MLPSVQPSSLTALLSLFFLYSLKISSILGRHCWTFDFVRPLSESSAAKIDSSDKYVSFPISEGKGLFPPRPPSWKIGHFSKAYKRSANDYVGLLVHNLAPIRMKNCLSYQWNEEIHQEESLKERITLSQVGKSQHREIGFAVAKRSLAELWTY